MKQARLFLKKGVSLLEVMLSLSIIATVLVMAVRYFGVARQKSNLDQARQQITAVISALIDYKNQNSSYPTSSGNFVADLINGGFLPQSGSVSSGALYSPWGEITVVGSDSGSTAILSLLGVPNAATCTDLTTSFYTSTCSGSTFQLSVPQQLGT